jgi:hypothetical protein
LRTFAPLIAEDPCLAEERVPYSAPKYPLSTDLPRSLGPELWE